MNRRSMMAAAVAALVGTALGGCGGGGGTDSTAVLANSADPAATGGPPVGSWWAPAGLAANTWHWTTTNPSGSVMVATAIPGSVYLSRDFGLGWAAQAGLPDDARWIGADLSDDGQVIVAIAIYGSMYRSVDGGASWGRIDSAFNPGGNLAYQSVTVSADGTRIVVAEAGGALWVSADGTSAAPTFTAAALAGGGALSSWWRAVDCDASGTRVVAASHNGDVWVSDDAGATFSRLDVVVGGATIEDGWYRLALSRDGSTLALAGNEEYGHGVAQGSRSSGIYIGRFAAGAWAFERGSAASGNFTRITIAANAPVIAATRSGAGGGLLVSLDDGASFATMPTPDGETAWRSIAITGDADRAVLAAGTFFATPGLLQVWWGSVAP